MSDLSSQWTDGLALCRLALHHDVAPTALTAALQVPSYFLHRVHKLHRLSFQKPPARRIPTVLQTLQTSRLLPPGLIDSDDLLDGRLHKLCCMTALLCLFQALRPTITQEMVEGVEVASDPSLTTKSSPTRHLPDLPSNLPPAGWTNVLEEVNLPKVHPCYNLSKCNNEPQQYVRCSHAGRVEHYDVFTLQILCFAGSLLAARG